MGFAELPDTHLLAFAFNTTRQLTGNPAYPTLPVPLATLEALASAFQVTLAAAALGGMLQTAEKNEARAALLAAWRQTAAYVQTVAGADLAMLLSSGFVNVSTNRAQQPLTQPAIVVIKNQVSTELLVRLTPVANARSYELRVCTDPGAWQPAGLSTQARRIVLRELIPGTVYTVQARAVGGSTGYSDWSDPVSHRAM